MSLSIGTVPPVPSSNGPAAGAAKSSGLPFDAMLDDQTDANHVATGDVCDADVPVDLQIAAIAALGATQNGTDSFVGPPGALAVGIRRFMASKDDINPEAALLTAIGKDKPPHEAASLLLLAVQDIVHRLESLEAPDAIGLAHSRTSNIPTGLAADDQALPNLPELVEGATSSPGAETAADIPPAAVSPSTMVTDLFTTESSSATQGDQAHPLDGPFSRQTAVPPAPAIVDAIQLATGQGSFADQDKDFGQPPPAADRRSPKGAAIATIRLAEAIAGPDWTVRSSTAPLAPAAPLPNEAAVVSSIVQTMRLQMRDGVGTAVVHLEPDYLGVVSIALRVENGVVTASLHAENPQVRAWMEANESQLRESLASQGLSLDRLIVTDERIGEERAPDRRHQQEQQQRARPRRRHDTAATFEVVV